MAAQQGAHAKAGRIPVRIGAHKRPGANIGQEKEAAAGGWASGRRILRFSGWVWRICRRWLGGGFLRISLLWVGLLLRRGLRCLCLGDTGRENAGYENTNE